MFQWTKSWILLRADHSAIRSGQLIDLFYDDNAYVFARKDQNETVVIAFNRDNSERQIQIPVRSIRNSRRERTEVINRVRFSSESSCGKDDLNSAGQDCGCA
jgi:alpha-glucosidase